MMGVEDPDEKSTTTPRWVREKYELRRAMEGSGRAKLINCVRFGLFVKLNFQKQKPILFKDNYRSLILVWLHGLLSF